MGEGAVEARAEGAGAAGSTHGAAWGRLEAHLRAQRDAGAKLLVPYVTGGLGKDWVEVVHAYAAAGADAIEVGVPFSDPAMDGPTIQAASDAALEAGANLPGILDDLRGVDVEVPLVVMTYVNLVFHMGYDRFASEAVACGVSGVILPDVPMEELGEWEPAATASGIETTLLASPVTPDDRLRTLCERSRGFVYGVNLLGVTGERTSVAATSAALAQRMKAVTDRPVVMGFGIATPAQAAEVAATADGVVVASRLMRLRLDGAGPDDLGAAVAELRAALDG